MKFAKLSEQSNGGGNVLELVGREGEAEEARKIADGDGEVLEGVVFENKDAHPL